MRIRLSPHHAGGMAFHRTPIEVLVEKLSGWQRKQWVRAGQPMDEASLRRFAQLQRGEAQLRPELTSR